MSGFGFCISCRACGLASHSYPLIYETVSCPTTLVLPVMDRSQRMFDRLEIPVTKRCQRRIASHHRRVVFRSGSRRVHSALQSAGRWLCARTRSSLSRV